VRASKTQSGSKESVIVTGDADKKEDASCDRTKGLLVVMLVLLL
jgi:hypothetical protein